VKAWAIIYNDKVIFETVRRTRRECISAFMQDKDLDNIKWSDRYSDRNRWMARQIEINWINDVHRERRLLIPDDSDREGAKGNASATKTSRAVRMGCEGFLISPLQPNDLSWSGKSVSDCVRCCLCI
jgi:hypothetical protein